MPIAVEPPSRHLLESMTTRFALQQDNWNDFSFQTLYHLHHKGRGSKGTITYIGGVKILKKGQRASDPLLIQKPFTRLSENWVSVGTSLDYYQRLNELTKRDRSSIMRALNDVVAFPDLVKTFEDEEGWETSLFRENRSWRSFLEDAQALYEGNFSALADLEESIRYTPAGADEPVEFDFSSPEPEHYFGRYRRVGPHGKKTLLPNRILVLVGRNGSGKSTIIARLAHVAFASPEERATKSLRALGKLDPPSIGFTRIITISYSAFDSFIVPGLDAKELSQTSRDLESGEGRFVFCGLRDLVAEARSDVDEAPDERASSSQDVPAVERRTTTRLKSVDQLADEFAGLLKRIREMDRIDLLDAALGPLLADPSFAELVEDVRSIRRSRRSVRKKRFLGWSAGHKIALHVIVSLVAHAMPRSLVLFDEPEAHLHPPLMAAMMHAIRIVLTDQNALCVVATHSPVLLQETLSKHVRRVRRIGEKLEIKQPDLETFGENIGVLTYDTFGLTASSTDFHQILDLLVDGSDSPDEVDALFEPGMSAQARAYVLARFASKA